MDLHASMLRLGHPAPAGRPLMVPLLAPGELRDRPRATTPQPAAEGKAL